MAVFAITIFANLICVILSYSSLKLQPSIHTNRNSNYLTNSHMITCNKSHPCNNTIPFQPQNLNNHNSIHIHCHHPKSCQNLHEYIPQPSLNCHIHCHSINSCVNIMNNTICECHGHCPLEILNEHQSRRLLDNSDDFLSSIPKYICMSSISSHK